MYLTRKALQYANSWRAQTTAEFQAPAAAASGLELLRAVTAKRTEQTESAMGAMTSLGLRDGWATGVDGKEEPFDDAKVLNRRRAV